MNSVALIIPHYADVSNTLECLESLKTQSIYPQLHIYLTNQSEKEFEGEGFTKEHPRVIPIQLSRNLGFGGACNVGLKKALEDNCEIFVILNNDVILDKYCINDLVTYASSFTKGAVVSPKIYFYKGQEYHTQRYTQEEKGRVIWYAGGKLDADNVYASHRGVDEVDGGQYDMDEETDFATGCCMAITRSVLEEVGFFDEKYFLYYEDVDLSLRCKDKGMGVLYYAKAHLWHKNASGSGKPGSKVHEYYQTRNRLYLGYRYSKFRTKLALLRESMMMFRAGGLKKKAVSDYYLGHMGHCENI